MADLWKCPSCGEEMEHGIDDYNEEELTVWVRCRSCGRDGVYTYITDPAGTCCDECGSPMSRDSGMSPFVALDGSEVGLYYACERCANGGTVIYDYDRAEWED